MDEMYLYDDYPDDTMSVKSNKIIKPLKGGMQFHWSYSKRPMIYMEDFYNNILVSIGFWKYFEWSYREKPRLNTE